jgi:hypothetical protein
MCEASVAKTAFGVGHFESIGNRLCGRPSVGASIYLGAWKRTSKAIQLKEWQWQTVSKTGGGQFSAPSAIDECRGSYAVHTRLDSFLAFHL